MRIIYVTVSVYVCMYVRLSAIVHLKNRMSKLHQNFSACCMWPRLRSLPNKMQYVMALPVLWVTSCLHMTIKFARHRRRKYGEGSNWLSRSSTDGTNSDVYVSFLSFYFNFSVFVGALRTTKMWIMHCKNIRIFMDTWALASLFRRFMQIQTYTEPVSLRYGNSPQNICRYTAIFTVWSNSTSLCWWETQLLLLVLSFFLGGGRNQ